MRCHKCAPIMVQQRTAHPPPKIRGSDADDRISQGTTGNYPVPVPLAGLENSPANHLLLAVGGDHCCFLVGQPEEPISYYSLV